MSYSYFLQAHLNKDNQEIPLASILTIFNDHVVTVADSYVDLVFEEGNCCTIYVDTTKITTTGFTIDRPCFSKRLGECIYEVMQLGNFVFFEPDGKAPIITNPVVEDHLPPDMIETLGKPAIGSNKEHFLELYECNR